MSNKLVEEIHNKIESGEVKMRSSFSILSIKIAHNTSILMIFLIMVLLSGFVFYWINSNRDLLTNGYDGKGFWIIFDSFPYVLLIGFIVFFFHSKGFA